MAYDDENAELPRHTRPPSPSKMSKTPSWITVGFLLGVLFMWALPTREKKETRAEPMDQVAPSVPLAPRPPPQLTTIEAVFEQWKEHAVWSDGTTEVAFWNPQERAFTDFYEVRRYGNDTYFFRTIPALTRRIITHGKPLPESPLQFTETEEQYQEWRKYGRVERSPDVDFRPSPPKREGIAPVDRALDRPSTPGPGPSLELKLGVNRARSEPPSAPGSETPAPPR